MLQVGAARSEGGRELSKDATQKAFLDKREDALAVLIKGFGILSSLVRESRWGFYGELEGRRYLLTDLLKDSWWRYPVVRGIYLNCIEILCVILQE